LTEKNHYVITCMYLFKFQGYTYDKPSTESSDPYSAREGEPIASALMSHGILIHRRTHKTGENRGVFCGIGQCNDCVMIVDGIPNVRTCVTAVKDGMSIETQNGYGTWI